MSVDAAQALTRGREAMRVGAWRRARELLEQADGASPLDPHDRVELAMAAFLLGDDEAQEAQLERAHDDARRSGASLLAARAAFWLGLGLMERGDHARGGGWLARARRLVPETMECAEQAYLLLPTGLQALGAGDADGAAAAFERAHALGVQFDDPDVRALGGLGMGQAAILRGDVAAGVALLDEAMLAVTSGEVSPVPAGIVYCAVISACHEISDLRRAHQWTEALTAWCEAQPDLVPYRGQCLVHRTELMTLHGAWEDALREADRACERLGDPPGQPAIGDAHYQRGEVLHLRGEFAAAEEAYREASRQGRTPQPGLALLRLAQGELDAASATIERVLAEPAPPTTRARHLAVAAELALADDDVDAAREASEELAALATELGAPMLDAMAAHVAGAVRLAQGDPRGALSPLRRAEAAWREVDAPYEAARVRVLAGLACRELGDADGADLELDAAAATFDELGASPDRDRLARLRGRADRGAPGGLSPRECEVLRLVAAGESNRGIAETLVISEHTVARHLQNIFAKLGVGSRTAAAAWAFEHELV